MQKSKDDLAVAIGLNIRRIRKMRKMTIEALAFDIGIEYTQLSRIERGKINTSLYQLYIISKALEVTMTEIFEGVDTLTQ